ncbi:Tn7 transposase TnsA N-terminal domain-containing protein [Nostoc sp.]
MDTIIWWESQIERDYIYLLEIDPTVQSYRGQPFKITYISKGVTKNYTPDFWVQRIGQQQVIEVKPASQVNDQKLKVMFKHYFWMYE